MTNEKRLREAAEGVDPPEQGRLDRGDEAQPKHAEAEKLPPIVPVEK